MEIHQCLLLWRGLGEAFLSLAGMHLADYLVYAFLLIAALLSAITRKLTPAGAVTGLLTGLLIYEGTGYTGLAMLALFFVSGTLATRFQSAKKQQTNNMEHDSARTAGQVLANGGVAAILSAIAWVLPQQREVLLLLTAGSLAAATADTLSSELGMVFGKRFYNVLNFKPDQRGLDGVISLEGTLIGVAGAALIAIVYAAGYGRDTNLVRIIIAGAIGNYVDSVLGASLERKRILTNNVVNFLNTLTGALICWLLSRFI